MEVRPAFSALGYRGSGKLDDFATIVTGGDSGIGRAVAIVCLNEHADAEETKRCVEAEGKRCVLIPGDVKDAAFCRDAVDTALREFGKLDVLVNNTAFQEHASSIVDLSEERFDETLRTNVYGYFHMAKAAAPHLKEGGSIVNRVGDRPARQWRPDRLFHDQGRYSRIHDVPGQQRSTRGNTRHCGGAGSCVDAVQSGRQAAQGVEEFGAKTLMGRPAQPEELAPAYVCVAAPACASYITGMILPVTGCPS